jgi:hypothetical protein
MIRGTGMGFGRGWTDQGRPLRRGGKRGIPGRMEIGIGYMNAGAELVVVIKFNWRGIGLKL